MLKVYALSSPLSGNSEDNVDVGFLFGIGTGSEPPLLLGLRKSSAFFIFSDPDEIQ